MQIDYYLCCNSTYTNRKIWNTARHRSPHSINFQDSGKRKANIPVTVALSRKRKLLSSQKHFSLPILKPFNRFRLFATPWTVALQAPLSVGFSRRERWSGLPFPSPGDLPDPGIKPRVSCIILLCKWLPCFLFSFLQQYRHPHITWIKLFVFGDLRWMQLSLLMSSLSVVILFLILFF